MVLKKQTASTLLPLAYLISCPSVSLSAGQGEQILPVPVAICNDHHGTEDNKQRLYVRMNVSGDTDICQPWPLSWSLAGPENGENAPLPMAEEMLAFLKGTGSFE